jgi:Zn ribbon nucleic-acid-binding protein
MKDGFIGCKQIISGYEIEVVECLACGFHLGVDASYLGQVSGVTVVCPSCSEQLHVPGEGDDDQENSIKDYEK